jgi:hypothetical protein
MKDLQKMTVTIDRCQVHTGSETIYGDLKVWMRMEAASNFPIGKHAPGLTWISFLMIGDEGQDLFAGRASTLTDGYHSLRCFGELWTFHDTDHLYSGDSAGIAQIKYRRVTVPLPVQRFILADIEDAIRQYDAQVKAGGKPQEICLDYQQRLSEWSAYYGRGKGRIVVNGPEDEIEALKGEETFDRSWESISRLALSETHSKDDEGRIKIYRESPNAFMWIAGSMNGGLINHGSKDSPDWSVHT